MNILTCTVDECERPIRSQKLRLCNMHYKRWMKTGDTSSQRPRFSTPQESFESRIAWVGECLEWMGARYSTGYGVLAVGGHNQAAHRFAWERANGPIPGSVEIDHLCFNRACCNVEHLRLATHKQNNENLRGAKSNNKSSGVRGVKWEPRRNRWVASVMHDRKAHYGGSYESVKDAEAAAIELRTRLFTHNAIDRT